MKQDFVCKGCLCVFAIIPQLSIWEKLQLNLTKTSGILTIKKKAYLLYPRSQILDMPECPGFSLDWDNFFSVASTPVLLLAQCCFGFSVRTALITQFWLLLSTAYPKSKTFQFPMLWQQACAQAGRQHGQETWPEQAKEVFHTINVIYSLYGVGSYPDGGWLWFGSGLGTIVVCWAVASLVFTGFSLSLPLLLYSAY